MGSKQRGVLLCEGLVLIGKGETFNVSCGTLSCWQAPFWRPAKYHGLRVMHRLHLEHRTTARELNKTCRGEKKHVKTAPRSLVSSIGLRGRMEVWVEWQLGRPAKCTSRPTEKVCGERIEPRSYVLEQWIELRRSASAGMLALLVVLQGAVPFSRCAGG